MTKNTVFLSGLPTYTNKGELKDQMKEFGKIKYVRIFSVTKKDETQKVYAKVKYEDFNGATKAVKASKISFGSPEVNEIAISWVKSSKSKPQKKQKNLRRQRRNQSSSSNSENFSKTQGLTNESDNTDSKNEEDKKLTETNIKELQQEFKRYKKENFKGVVKISRLMRRDKHYSKIPINHYLENLQMRSFRLKRRVNWF